MSNLTGFVVRRGKHIFMYQKHLYAIGKSGSGKSTLLEYHALNNPSGWIFLDPHGDTADKLADTIPCIYWETSDTEHVIGFNVLENVREPERHLVAAQVVGSFKAIWGESWGPRLEWILYNALRLLLDNNGSLLAIPSVLTDDPFRKGCLKRSTLPDFWRNEFDEWDDRYRSDAIAPVLNKVGQFVANPVLAQILRHNTLNLRRVMDKGQRLVVNLSKGKLGEEPSHLLGALLVSAISQAAHDRATVPQNQRVPFTLYIDEFQNFATDSFASLLSEARKYGVFCVLSHQFLGQLPDLLRQAVFGNVGCIISFRVGAEDAPVIARELGLRVAENLVDLDAFKAYVREGLQYERIEMLPPAPSEGRLEANRRQTRAAYTR